MVRVKKGFLKCFFFLLQQRMKMKVAFLENLLSIRGSTVALYDYAHHNERLLHNESIVITRPLDLVRANLDASEEVYAKVRDRFPLFFYRNHADVQRILDTEGVDVLYIIKSGARDGVLDTFDRVKTLMHCVFDPRDPHGDRFCVISPWLNRAFSTALPVLPHMIDLPDVEGQNLRQSLGIPEDAVVFGRHGGWREFDHPAAVRAVKRLATERPDVYFVFLNTMPFMNARANVLFLDRTADVGFKARFLNTCDAMIYARSRGETFGLAIGEFSIRNKPVFAPLEAPDRMHQVVLQDRAYWYWSEDDLYAKMRGFDPAEARKQEWDMYKEFSPAAVMRMFEQELAHACSSSTQQTNE